MNAFHVCGILLALWALVVTFIGISRESFPATDGQARAVAAISVVLTIGAISTGLYTAATEEHGGEAEEHSLLLPR